MLTRPDFASVLERYQSVPQASRLSMPALEVLAILAYRQPLGRLEIEEIRGVQSSAVLRTLQDRGLIEPVGRAEGLGRPVLYGTTAKFLEHFGFRSLEDLPRPDDLPVILRARPIAETPAPPAPFATAEPTPLSPDAEAEAEALHLPVHPARDHPADADGLESADPHAGSEVADEPTGAAVPEEVPDAATGNGVLAEAAGETPESGEPDANEVLAAADPSEQDADDAPDGEEAGAAYLRD
jgi:hypothetical protein